MTRDGKPPTGELHTVKDWLRYAVSRFRAANLAYGHGSDNAVDEAAFLILVTLHLPIDQLETWLDCRLSLDERERVFRIIEDRIRTRKPAAYLVKAAWIQGCKFYVDERVIVPRSFIGELISRDALASVVSDPLRVHDALDLCTGSGCLAILAALALPNARILAVDISADALAVAQINVEDYGLSDKIELVRSNLFSSLKPHKFDLIVSNPPYVTTSSINAFPPEHAAEPRLAHDGGVDGLAVVRQILERAGDFLADDGQIVVEVGQAREALEAEYPDLPFLWLDTETSEGEVFALSADQLRARGRASRPSTKVKS